MINNSTEVSKINKKRLILIISVILLIIFIIVYFLIFNKKTDTFQIPGETQTPITVENIIPPTITPQSGIFSAAGSYNAISIDFFEPVNIDNLNIESTPKIELSPTKRKDLPNTIILSPRTPWEENSYQIKITANFSSLDQKRKLNFTKVLNYTVKPLIVPEVTTEREEGT